MKHLFSVSALLLAFFLVMAAGAQETAKEPAKTPMTPTARLHAAQTAFVKNVDGSDIGFDTVTTTLEGWGRYKLVDSPKDADLLIEVTSPEEAGGVSVTSSTSGISRTTGHYEDSTSTSRDISSGGGTMRMVVRDAKTKLTLWAGSEPVKGSMKKNVRENHLVDAAQKLVSKFHDRVEPIK